MELCGLKIPEGTKKEVTISTGAHGYDLPAIIVCGAKPGMVLLLTAQIHAMEYNGTPSLLEIAQRIDPSKLTGNVIILPCVNLNGAKLRHPRTLPEDGFNLNADFPGREDCPVGSALAGWFIREIFPKIDFICDLHGGSVDEVLSPCLFYPRASGKALSIARGLDVPTVIASDARCGLYSYAWHTFSIPGILLERGWGCTCRDDWVQGHRRNVCLVMQGLGMYDWSEDARGVDRKFFDRSEYLESDRSGLWRPLVFPGEHFAAGQTLGVITDSFGKEIQRIVAGHPGFVYYETGGLTVQPGSSLIACGIEETP